MQKFPSLVQELYFWLGSSCDWIELKLRNKQADFQQDSVFISFAWLFF